MKKIYRKYIFSSWFVVEKNKMGVWSSIYFHLKNNDNFIIQYIIFICLGIFFRVFLQYVMVLSRVNFCDSTAITSFGPETMNKITKLLYFVILFMVFCTKREMAV